MDADLIKAKEVMERHGFEVVMPGLVAHTDVRERGREGATIERPATDAAEMERALASSAPGGDLSMASHAGLALKCGELENRVVLLESGLTRLARALLHGGDPVERPEHVEHEPEPVGPVEDEYTVEEVSEALREREPEHGRVERGPDDLPNLNTPDPAALCTCGHTRLQHNGQKYACYAGTPANGASCECSKFVESPGLIS